MLLKYLLAFLLVMHGLAHVTGLVGAFSSGEQAFAINLFVLVVKV